MPLELCRTRTADGLTLSGLMMRPDAEPRPSLPVDAFLIVHGTASNFYAKGVLESFATQAVAAGVPALRINTRGHDPVATISSTNGPVQAGAAYESIDDCCLDLTAWIDLLVEHGYAQIALVGHSMGAVKSIYSQSQAAHPAVNRVIGISPPRFCHKRLASGPKGEQFLDDFGRAVQLVDEGRGEELMSVCQPLPLMLTAAGFLAKYGPHDNYDIVRQLPALQCPTLVILGTGSVASSAAFAGLPAEIERLANDKSELSFELVEDADTGYTTCPTVPFERAAAWLTQR